MALKGTLRDFSLADIFQLIGIQKKTGVLTLKSAQEVVTVTFVSGEVVAADSLNRRLEDRLGTVLVKTGRISEAQLQEALRIQKSTLKRMGHTLVERGFIDAGGLREALQIQITQMIYRLFRWRDGEYNFSQEERVEYDKDNVVPMSAESILMEGARILDEWPMIERALKSFTSVFRRANVEIAPEDQTGASGGTGEEGAPAVTLNDEERLVHALVDGKRSVQEVVERSTLSEFDTCRVLYELSNRQLIEEVRSPLQKSAAVAAPAAVRETSPMLIGIGYMLLVLVGGSLLLVRARPWVLRLHQQETIVTWLSPLMGSEEVEEVGVAISKSRRQRLDFALKVYYLLNRGYPEELRYLAVTNLLHPAAIRDPMGRPYPYETLQGGYHLGNSMESPTAVPPADDGEPGIPN